MTSGNRLTQDFFIRDVLEVAPDIVGKNMVVRLPGGEFGKFMITEVASFEKTLCVPVAIGICG